jgi:adenylate cyclase
MPLALSSLGRVFDGVFPTTLATCSASGDVNVIFVSQVHYVDEEHVAFSEQFLQRTVANLRENPRAQAWLIEPTSGVQYRLDLAFVRRETEGALVARMRAKLDGIAEAAGMTEVFRLRAALVCRVLAIREVPVATEASRATPEAQRPLDLRSLGGLADALSRAEDLGATCRALLDGLVQLGYEHSILLVTDEAGRSLVTVDSRGFAESGIGSEVDVGHGIFGRCAATRQVVRVSAMSREETYVRASRPPRARHIFVPALAGAESLLAVPLVSRDRLVGVLAVESAARAAFGEVDEAALKLVAHFAASAISLAEREPPPDAADPRSPVRIRYYEEDDSVFVDDTYVVKGLAGRVLLAIVKGYMERGRTEITNRELRLDPAVRLSPINDNLEARLLLLRRRLEERCPRVRVVPVTRGRLRLECSGPVDLEVVRSLT